MKTKEDCSVLPEMNQALHAVQEDGALSQRDREILFASNLHLVESIAEQYKDFGISIEVLEECGKEGLNISVAKYDARGDKPFCVLATWWIKNKISQEILQQKQQIQEYLTQKK